MNKIQFSSKTMKHPSRVPERDHGHAGGVSSPPREVTLGSGLHHTCEELLRVQPKAGV